ncbi:hypothetical protein EDI_232750 [Entamoeba dispar SAW760]|uniref:Uncharacterized protein n=1 Tax=Entamoeba dispar (strain ATCC PRA-260 / SAW760) TaxID=370354 RepID=B0EPT9_ENTDS|nr:uncharacterized protein EDI_232750 [Entamoeba dispar SAW760]EDR23463.1 hypothetical protein EDI_232750 [Entamoeba dispar SAW760]|eukprot:EDR23463.1 hypothetical protein EDI_232750 [Entamoeba dispar SAW760]
MSSTVDDKIEYYSLSDLTVSTLHDFYLDLDDLHDLCSTMVDYYKKEQRTTLGSDKYSNLIESEVFLVKDIASSACKMLQKYKTVINAFKQCHDDRELARKELNKPKK